MMKPLTVQSVTLGQFIRERRMARGLSATEMAERLEITPQALWDIERGRRYPSSRLLAEIGTVLHVPPGEFTALDPRPLLVELREQIEKSPALRNAFGLVMAKIKQGSLTPERLAEQIAMSCADQPAFRSSASKER